MKGVARAWAAAQASAAKDQAASLKNRFWMRISPFFR
jgi:hypothetical protein